VLAQELAVTDALLYRRGNFNGSWDQLICDALMEVGGAEIAFSPGFRWGTSLLPGDTITRERLMDQLAITYPYATLTEMSGETIKTVLEDVADNLFNPDPYYQQGGDMVRVGGLAYACDPEARMGQRISAMRLGDRPIEAGKKYKVAGWAPVAEEARTAPGAKPIWDVVETWLRAQRGHVGPRVLNTLEPRGPKGESWNGALVSGLRALRAATSLQHVGPDVPGPGHADRGLGRRPRRRPATRPGHRDERLFGGAVGVHAGGVDRLVAADEAVAGADEHLPGIGLRALQLRDDGGRGRLAVTVGHMA
jgi:hypothetical protein